MPCSGFINRERLLQKGEYGKEKNFPEGAKLEVKRKDYKI
jgi:hypothetical protein